MFEPVVILGLTTDQGRQNPTNTTQGGEFSCYTGMMRWFCSASEDVQPLQSNRIRMNSGNSLVGQIGNRSRMNSGNSFYQQDYDDESVTDLSKLDFDKLYCFLRILKSKSISHEFVGQIFDVICLKQVSRVERCCPRKA